MARFLRHYSHYTPNQASIWSLASTQVPIYYHKDFRIFLVYKMATIRFHRPIKHLLSRHLTLTT